MTDAVVAQRLGLPAALRAFTLASQPLLLGIGFAVLVAISATTVWLVEYAQESGEWVSHTLRNQNTLATLRLDFRQAESAERGYLLTGHDSALQEFRSAMGELWPQLADLKERVADNPVQLRTITELEPLMAAQIEGLEQAVRLYQDGDREAAIETVRSGRLQQRLAQIVVLLDRIGAEEERLLRERIAGARRSNTMLIAVTLSGSGLVVLLALISVYLVRRSNRERDLAQRKLESINVNLEATVEARTADLLEANRELQRFAYVVSHDLRSPLVNVMGFTSELEALRKELFEELANLRSAEAPPEQAEKHATLAAEVDEALGFIKTAIAKMDRLINAILKLSREGRREFRPEQIDMTALVDGIADSISHQAAAAGATISVGTLPPLVSDRLALEQIFTNLIDNAIKYLRDDEPGQIAVSGSDTPLHAVYEVRDNGRGIDPADHQRVFDLFRRAGRQDRPGEGIGLAHVRALVRRLGGTMSLQSQPGQGSVFTVTLPRAWHEESRRSVA